MVKLYLKAKRMPGTKKEAKYIGPMTAVEVTDSHALVLKKGSDSKCRKYPLHISQDNTFRGQTKRKCTDDLPTDV